MLLFGLFALFLVFLALFLGVPPLSGQFLLLLFQFFAVLLFGLFALFLAFLALFLGFFALFDHFLLLLFQFLAALLFGFFALFLDFFLGLFLFLLFRLLYAQPVCRLTVAFAVSAGGARRLALPGRNRCLLIMFQEIFQASFVAGQSHAKIFCRLSVQAECVKRLFQINEISFFIERFGILL